MRIIGGKYRGKKLISPASDKVRPTSDKAREAMFNILRSRLGNDFGSHRLLDVFAGSGAFGCEALSQGFAGVGLVDIATTDLLKNTALFVAEKSRIEIFKGDAATIAPRGEKFDVMFMDAPYNQGLTQKALLNMRGWLCAKALCLIEVRKDEDCPLPSEYQQMDERRYGLAKVIVAEFVG
ncbi:MAG: RsmD family RNA methyltransferase [Alphaproteobacteria bacterium]|nr:RsmD family RNA methyltransferase [Alphaproteobacteria bacterium]